MTIYLERPNATTARKVWDHLAQYARMNHSELKEIFFCRGGSCPGKWCFVALGPDPSSPWRRLEGTIRSDLSSLASEWVSARGSWDFRS